MSVKPGDQFAICGYEDLYEIVEVVGHNQGYDLWRVEYRTGDAVGVLVEVTESTFEPVERYHRQQQLLQAEFDQQ
jgi:hypothetical protein